MNQVKEMSRVPKVIEKIKLIFTALSVNEDIVQDPEEQINNSGYKELIESSKRIEKMEKEYETRIAKTKLGLEQVKVQKVETVKEKAKVQNKDEKDINKEEMER